MGIVNDSFHDFGYIPVFKITLNIFIIDHSWNSVFYNFRIFVLKSLINKYIHKNKKKIYACFVDLRKAFDSVWRETLL
jgi:hypothetical protein